MTDTTTRNLARKVAIALGMKLVKLDKPEVLDWYEPVLGHQVHIERWFYIDLLGENISNVWDVELNAWEHAIYPDYPNDLNACARNLTREGYRVILRWQDGRWVVFYQ